MAHKKKFTLCQFRSHLVERTEHENNKIKNDFFTWSQTAKGMNNRDHVFYREFRPFWVTFKILGMLPYHVDQQGDVITKFLSKEMLYCIFFYTMSSVPVVYVIYSRSVQILTIKDNFDSMMFSITMFCLMVPHIVIPLSHWMEMNSFQTVCKIWKDFQIQYENVTGNPFAFDSCWKVFVVLPCLMLYIFVIISILVVGVDTDLQYEILAHVYVVTLFFLHSVIFVGQCYVITCIAKDIKTKLKKVVEEDREDEVPRWSQLWFHLSKLTRYTGVLFYRMYAHLFMMVFIVTTIAMYCVLKAVFIEHFSMLLMNSFVCLHVGELWIYVVCECGERVTNEVGWNFLMDMMDMKFETKNPSIRTKIQEIAETINYFPPIISLNGYLVINRRFLVSIAATGATYLFVVLQFSQTSLRDSSFRNNSSQITISN